MLSGSLALATVMAFLGENGAGKSITFLELMTIAIAANLYSGRKSVKFDGFQQIDTFATKETLTVLELLSQYKTSYLQTARCKVLSCRLKAPVLTVESLPIASEGPLWRPAQIPGAPVRSSGRANVLVLTSQATIFTGYVGCPRRPYLTHGLERFLLSAMIA